jgi:hypothetical protein
VRRIGVVGLLALLLSVGVPSGALPDDGGHTSVSWLWTWLAQPPSWAKDPSTPAQPRGKGVAGHYVQSPRVPEARTPAKRAAGELPAFQQRRASAPTRTTGRAEPGFQAGTSRRVASAATATSDVFENADGSYTRRVHRTPVNYRAGDGSWQPIDSNLALDARRRPAVKANSLGPELRDRLVAPVRPGRLGGDRESTRGR